MRGLRIPGSGRRVKAGAPARLQIAHRNEAIVGLGHCEAADVVDLGKLADRRQLGAGPEMPFFDLSLDAGDDLVGEALAPILTDDEGEHDDFPPLRIGSVAGPVQLCQLTAKVSITMAITVCHY